MSTTVTSRVGAGVVAPSELRTTWLMAVSDATALLIAATLSLGIFHRTGQPWIDSVPFFAQVPLTLGTLAAVGAYRLRRLTPAKEFQKVFSSTIPGYGLGYLCVWLWTKQTGLLAEALAAWALTVTVLVVCRALWRALGNNARDVETSVVLFGSGGDAHALYSALEANSPQLKIAGIFGNGGTDWLETGQRNIVTGETRWAASFAECCGVKHAIVAVPCADTAEIAELLNNSSRTFKHLLVVPRLGEPELRVRPSGAGHKLRLHVGNGSLEGRRQSLKRLLDLCGAVSVSVILAPLIVITAIAIRLSSKGPLFFRQIRIGRGNRAFRVWKFRTMYVNNDERLKHYLGTNLKAREEWDSFHKLKKDPRVTPVGRFLRRFSLDELPQLWNVIVGEMSLVGPRPIVVAEIVRYGRHYESYERVRPGLTGLWQVSGRNNTTYDERVGYDDYYVRNWSLALDLKILLRTVTTVVSGVGAY